jgi:hypothetical protein
VTYRYGEPRGCDVFWLPRGMHWLMKPQVWEFSVIQHVNQNTLYIYSTVLQILGGSRR